MSEWEDTCVRCGQTFDGMAPDVEEQIIEHYLADHAELLADV